MVLNRPTSSQTSEVGRFFGEKFTEAQSAIVSALNEAIRDLIPDLLGFGVALEDALISIFGFVHDVTDEAVYDIGYGIGNRAEVSWLNSVSEAKEKLEHLMDVSEETLQRAIYDVETLANTAKAKVESLSSQAEAEFTEFTTKIGDLRTDLSTFTDEARSTFRDIEERLRNVETGNLKASPSFVEQIREELGL